MKKIAIVGSGGLGREVLGIIESINKVKKIWEFIGFYDDNLSESLVNGFPVLGDINALNFIEEELNIAIAIGNPNVKEDIRKIIKNPKIIFPNIIHPSVIIYSENTVSFGKGIVVGANVVLTTNISVEDYVYINTASVISHDTKVGTYSMIMPTVSISAGAIIGKNVYVGNGVKIDQPIIINDNSFIKAGTILSK